jgi:aminopeptidase-like protein
VSPRRFDIPANASEKGREAYALIEELYPICRSITGNGIRQTLETLKRTIPLQVHEVPSGTQVFDWTVPREWNIRDAYVKDAKGKKVIDFQKSNLHVLNYSVPVHRVLPLDELKAHLFTLPEHPDWIPYRTSYYRENWGFCMRHRDYLALEEGAYEIFIDSSLENGSLTYGEFYLRGDEESEILISCHACHPSLCNDNLSGVALATLLAKQVFATTHRYSYRFLFIPGTIGAITWLALNEEKARKIRHGLVLTGLGDPGPITYKRSRQGDAEIDRAALYVLKHSGQAYDILAFDPYGYDERQYCSPGFDLPVGRLSRTPYGVYPEYHTSADNLEFVHPESLGDSFSRLVEILYILENNRTYRNLNPKCEPQLGKRGLYASAGLDERALLWVLNYSDGRHDLLDIATKSALDFTTIEKAAESLLNHQLIEEYVPSSPHGERGD